MRLFVKCKYCDQKIYINSPAKTRQELPYHFYLKCPYSNCSLRGIDTPYTPYDVWAEAGTSAIGGAIIVGALGGLIAGPIGALFGALLGAKGGESADQVDKKAVERFNSSW